MTYKAAPAGWYWHEGLQRGFPSTDVWDVDVDTPGPCYSGYFLKPEVAERLGVPVTVDDCRVEPMRHKFKPASRGTVAWPASCLTCGEGADHLNHRGQHSTMSEKTITRYYGSTGKPMCLLSDHEAALAAARKEIDDALEASNEAGFAFMSPAEVIRHQAQENAELKQQLDTLKLALQVECEKNAAKDARIAELVRERDAIQFKLEGTQRDAKEAFANWRDFQQAYSSLRAAIRAKAREWKQSGSREDAKRRGGEKGFIYDQCAAELRKLLEGKP